MVGYLIYECKSIVKSFENSPVSYNFHNTVFISHALFALGFIMEAKLELLKPPYLCICILAESQNHRITE